MDYVVDDILTKLSDKVDYSEGVTVKDKIDDLYTKVKPSYTGSTTITPATSTQTLSTNGKVLNSNITINPIPSSYKELTTTTDVSANSLLSGVKAYTSDGELVTGNISTDCVSGNFVWQSSYSTNGYQIANFKPSYFLISGTPNDGIRYIFYYNNSISTNNFYNIKIPSNGDESINYTTTSLVNNTKWAMDNNGLIMKWSTGWTGYTINYMICK